tara:strand:+ start:8400 stop:10037 length:1638 start_codon:yes stop_codon:yes gene_type:complete
MKNILKNLKYTNKILFLITIFLVFMFFCIYKLNNNKSLKEFYENILDNCNSCSAKPYSGNCKPIYDISININTSKSKEYNRNIYDISLIDISLVFCEWESIGNSCMLDESNNFVKNYKDYLCCNESIYTNNLKTINKELGLESNCANLNRYQLDLTSFLDKNTANKMCKDQTIIHNKNIHDDTILQVKNDISGAVFYKYSIDLSLIFLDESLTKRELLDYLNVYEIKYRKTYLTLKGIPDGFNSNGYEKNKEYYNTEKEYKNDLKKVNDYDNNYENISNFKKTTDLSINIIKNYLKNLDDNDPLYDDYYYNIKYDLLNMISVSDVSYYTIKYVPFTKTQVSDYIKNYKKDSSYVPSIYDRNRILMADEYMDCSGRIHETQNLYNENMYFDDLTKPDNPYDLNIIDNSNYFFTRIGKTDNYDDTTWKAYKNTQDTPVIDREMENIYMDSLNNNLYNNIDDNNKVSVNVINTYLNAINNFYEKNINKRFFDDKHDKLIFENNQLKINRDSFYSNQNIPNDISYSCYDNPTRRSEYCGPEPYYETKIN